MSKYWWYMLPGEGFANDMQFHVKVSEQDVREWLRARLKAKRLPNGTEVWAR